VVCFAKNHGHCIGSKGEGGSEKLEGGHFEDKGFRLSPIENRRDGSSREERSPQPGCRNTNVSLRRVGSVTKRGKMISRIGSAELAG